MLTHAVNSAIIIHIKSRRNGMKKLLQWVPMIVLSALLLSMPAYAQAETELPPQTQDGAGTEEGADKEEAPTKTVVGIDLKEDDLDRVIEIGQTPDFTDTEFVVTYDDSSFENFIFDPTMLVLWQTDKKGRQPAVLEIAGGRHTEFFIVTDPNVNVLEFTDVTQSYWGYRQIQRAVQAGFFVGMSKTEFGVANGMTRAQFCQMIYSIYKTDETVFAGEKEVQFTDVPENMWYHEAIMACARAGIVSGMGDGTFKPDDFISRQDVAVIMMNVLDDLSAFTEEDITKALESAKEKGIAAADFDTVSPYARKYVAAALGVVFYGDQTGNLNPLSNITRTECAAMCTNLFFSNDKNKTPGKKLIYLSPESDTTKVYAIWKKNDPSTHEFTEHKQMTRIAQSVKAILEEMGYEVFIADPKTSIRDENKFNEPPVVPDNIYCRAEEAYDMGAAAYVALHSNGIAGTNNGSVQGTRSFYNGTNPGSAELASAIHNRVAALTPTTETSGAFQEDISYSATHGQTPYAEVWRPKMPNILLEIEFHDYAPYAQWIVDNTDAIAQAIADGIDEYFKSLE